MQESGNQLKDENILSRVQLPGTSENRMHPVSCITKTEDSESDENSMPGYEEANSQRSVCEQRLELWAVYQRVASEQFAALAGLYEQLEAVAAPPVAAPGPGQHSPRTPSGRARLAVRFTTCKQLYASSQQQSAVMAAQVRRQLRQLTGQLQRCRATFAQLAQIVQLDSTDGVAVSPDALLPAVRGALRTLTERADALSAELSEVIGRLERCQQRLQATPDTDPTQLRLQVQLEDRDRELQLSRVRADNARAQADELRTQLTELRTSSDAALEKSVCRLEGLQTELLEAHTKYRDSQRELYQTRSLLSREAASLRSERDALTARVDRYQRLEETSTERAALERESAGKALQALTADRRRLLERLSEAEAQRAGVIASFERARRDWRTELRRLDRSDQVRELRARLSDSERRLAAAEARHGDTSAALREELALRSQQLTDLSAQLLKAKRTIVEQEVQLDYVQQRLEDRGGSPPASDASQRTTTRLSEGSVSDSRLAAGGSRGLTTCQPGGVIDAANSSALAGQLAAAQQEVSRLTAQRREAARTADMLRTELRVALEALQHQRRETDLRLMSSSDTRLHELDQLDRQNRELRALSTRWQLRAEASERGCREAGEALERERAARLEMEASLVEASSKMREIQQQLERQDQYSTWAKLNQSLQLKQVESVMLALLKVAPPSVGGGTNTPRQAAPPAAGGGEVAPPSDPAAADCSDGSLGSSETEVEVATDASLAATEPERFQPLACDSSCGEAGEMTTEL